MMSDDCHEDVVAERDRLRGWWRAFQVEVDEALAARASRGAGGQQAGHGPVLSYAQVSALHELQRWCRNALDPRNGNPMPESVTT
jgi:hypothetical protein